MKENIILLHGALGSQQQMQALAPLLSPHFAVHSLNFLGHGGDPSETHFTMKALAQQVKTFIEEKQLGRTHIFGYSMGGYVALNLALDHPEQIQSIVTFGTKFNWSKEAAEKEVKMLNPELIEAKVPQFAQRLKDTHAPNDWKVLLQKTATMMLGLAAGEKLSDEALKQIDHHVLIGIGTLDKMVSIEESEAVVTQLKHGRLKIIEGFHHPIEKNDYQQLAQIITAFVQKS